MKLIFKQSSTLKVPSEHKCPTDCSTVDTSGRQHDAFKHSRAWVDWLKDWGRADLDFRCENHEPKEELLRLRRQIFSTNPKFEDCRYLDDRDQSWLPHWIQSNFGKILTTLPGLVSQFLYCLWIVNFALHLAFGSHSILRWLPTESTELVSNTKWLGFCLQSNKLWCSVGHFATILPNRAVICCLQNSSGHLTEIAPSRSTYGYLCWWKGRDLFGMAVETLSGYHFSDYYHGEHFYEPVWSLTAQSSHSVVGVNRVLPKTVSSWNFPLFTCLDCSGFPGDSNSKP